MRTTLAGLRAELDAQLASSVTALSIVDSLKEALEYSLFPSGKRIRPLFALALVADLDGDPGRMVVPCCALEVVHCASLVHDDLPALDNDDMRRGKPSLHKAFGEAAAVLVGDLLIPWAFRLITTSAPSELIKLKLADSLASGWQKVCYGQYLDTLPPNDRPDPLTINRYKTAALFECAANFAAIALETNEPTGKLFSNFGSEVGMLFQALDDFTDLFGSDVQRGRCGSSDDRNAKKTCLTGRTVEESQDLLSAHRMRVHDLLRELETNFSTKKFGNTAGLLGTLTTPPNHPRLTHTSRGACG